MTKAKVFYYHGDSFVRDVVTIQLSREDLEITIQGIPTKVFENGTIEEYLRNKMQCMVDDFKNGKGVIEK